MLSHCTLSRFCLREMRLQVREMEDKQPFAASPTGSPLRKNLAGSVCPKCQFFLGELAAFWGFAPVALECAGMPAQCEAEAFAGIRGKFWVAISRFLHDLIQLVTFCPSCLQS